MDAQPPQSRLATLSANVTHQDWIRYILHAMKPVVDYHRSSFELLPCTGQSRPALRREYSTSVWETSKSERGKDGITTCPFVFWLITSWCDYNRSSKKTPALTLPRTILLVCVLLPRRHFDLDWAQDVIAYRQKRNLAAYQSYRRSRLERLCPVTATTGEPTDLKISF